MYVSSRYVTYHPFYLPLLLSAPAVISRRWFGLSTSGLTCSESSSDHEHHKEIVSAQPVPSPHQGTCLRLGSSTDRAPCLPSASRHSVKSGHSLFKMAGDKRARKVRFYRNGDRFFKGMVFAVSPHRFRTFESLLAALTSSPLCNSKVMPSGVRCIFTLKGTRVESLDELQQGRSYVCSSTDVFRCLDYCSNQDPVWNAHVLSHNQSNHACVKVRLTTHTSHTFCLTTHVVSAHILPHHTCCLTIHCHTSHILPHQTMLCSSSPTTCAPSNTWTSIGVFPQKPKFCATTNPGWDNCPSIPPQPHNHCINQFIFRIIK